MVNHTFTLETTDMRALHAQKWLPDNSPHSIVCIIHGLGEHSGRYARIAELLTSGGYVVFAHDHQGHGLSPGRRGHADYDSMLAAIDDMVLEAYRLFKGIPLYLYGHSLGGNLALNYHMRYDQLINGIICSSPWLRLALHPSRTKMKLGRFMANVFPKWSEDSPITGSMISRLKEEAEAYDNDPLKHKRISAGLFFGGMRGAQYIFINTSQLFCPVLLLHGTADAVTDYRASEELAKMKPGNITLRLFKGAFHELHNDLCRAEFDQAVMEWLDEQSAKPWKP